MTVDSSSYFIGIDGGGSGCRVAICDHTGRRVAEAKGGAANFTTNPTETVDNLRDAIERAGASLGSVLLHGVVAHIGLAGVRNAEDAAIVAQGLHHLKATVTEDRVTATEGALGARSGVLTAVGTGSFVALKRHDQTRFLGGWGFQVGDQASGAWLGRAALEQCLLAQDGLLEESALTRTLLAQFDDDPAGIVAFAGSASAASFAEMAPVVVDAARAQDPNAKALMGRGADYLEACMTALGLQDTESICLTGGVGPHYRDFLKETFQERVRAPEGSALDGALRLAHDAFKREGGAA